MRSASSAFKQKAFTILLLLILLIRSSNASNIDVVAAPKPTNMLWVGNSFFYYNNQMHSHVGKLLNAAGFHDHHAESSTIRGASLSSHNIEFLLQKSNPLGPGERRTSHAIGMKNTITFDAVLMMDCSYCPINFLTKNKFHAYAKIHSDSVRKHHAEPIFFMTWAYADQPEMTEKLAHEYIQAGKDNKARVVPAGLAFAYSSEIRPDIKLIHHDRRHPTLAGTYLAACTTLAAVYGVDPRGNTYSSYLDKETVEHLQNIAWSVSHQFFIKILDKNERY